MPYTTSDKFSTEQAKLEGAYPIDMYIVNASLSGFDPLYYANLNQDVYGWSLNASGDMTWNATIYHGLPIERDNIGTNTQGEISEVSITIPNVDRVMESIIQNNDYLRGREIYFLSTFVSALPEPPATSVEDETGADWTPITTYAYFSFISGVSFIHVPNINIHNYARVGAEDCGYQIILKDNTGKEAIGYLQDVDSAYTWGTTLMTNGGNEVAKATFDEDSDVFCTSVQSSTTVRTGSYSTKITLDGTHYYGYRAFLDSNLSKLSEGACYFIYGYVYIPSGQALDTVILYLYVNGNVVGSVQTSVTDSWVVLQGFIRAGSSGFCGCSFYGYDSGLTVNTSSFYIDDLNIIQCHSSEAGPSVRVVPNPDSETEGWRSIESGFDYNATNYTFDIYGQYLTGIEKVSHLGTDEDKNAVLKEKLYIDSAYSDNQAVKFTCKSKFAIKNITIPKRTFMRECSWAIMDRYLATECDINNTINSASYPTCDGTLDNCRERRNSGRFGGFPAVPERGFTVIG